MMLPTVYLAGAIRDGKSEDIEWREDFVNELEGKATFLNPLGGKLYHSGTGQWTVCGQPSTARAIVKQDFWCVDRADIIVANLTPMASGYPSIGTIFELGRATARGCVVYVILDPGFTGHENGKMYGLHPFIAENSAMTFASVKEAIEFFDQYLDVLSGCEPNFGGVA